MTVRIVTDTSVLDKIDEVKKRFGIEVAEYSTAIGMICDVVLDDLELKEKYVNAMECLFTSLMERDSGNVDVSSDLMKECMTVYQSIAG